MPQEQTWLLSDVDADVHVDSIVLGPADVKGSVPPFRVRKRTLSGGVRDGVEVVEVEHGDLSYTVIATRGMGLWRASVSGLQLGWRAPARGPVHPKFVPLSDPSGLGWLYGFDELLCRCGLESNGAPEFQTNGTLQYPLHGRIANLPAHRLEVGVTAESGEIRVSGVVDEARLYGGKLRLSTTYRSRPGERSISIEDEVQNLSADPGGFQLLYHTNFGRPLLDAGSQVVLPVAQLVPRTEYAAERLSNWNVYPEGAAGVAESVYYFELHSDADGTSQALLKNAHGHQGVSLHFSKRQLPHFVLWKSPQADGDGYVTGLEPGVNFPNPRSFEASQQRIAPLKPGESRQFALRIEAHVTAAQVAAAEEAVARLSGGRAPKVFDTPQQGWVPA
jgi:galactose mutarotase-like enzyme